MARVRSSGSRKPADRFVSASRSHPLYRLRRSANRAGASLQAGKAPKPSWRQLVSYAHPNCTLRVGGPNRASLLVELGALRAGVVSGKVIAADRAAVDLELAVIGRDRGLSNCHTGILWLSCPLLPAGRSSAASRRPARARAFPSGGHTCEDPRRGSRLLRSAHGNVRGRMGGLLCMHPPTRGGRG